MKYVKFNYYTPYPGTDEDFYCVFDEVTEAELDEMLSELVELQADTFEHLATGPKGDFESDEDKLAYYEGCKGTWAFISREEYKNRT